MCQFLIGFLLVFVFGGAVLYESLRWVSLREECEAKRLHHHKLLGSEVCKKDYGESVEAACAKANLELRTSAIHCASMEWWKRGEIYHLYTRLTESSWILALLILFPIVYTIYKAFDTYQQNRTDDRTERMMSLYGNYPRQHLLLEPDSVRNKRRSHFIYNPSDERAL